MAGYDIAITGMDAAQRALSVIGNNIANAATPGYHRQEVDLRPADEVYTNGFMIGRGVDFAGIRRNVDKLLESELIRQQSALSSLERRSDSLQIIESAMGELTESGISASLDEFFGAMYQLSLRPEDTSLQTGVISSAESLATQISNLGTLLSNLQETFFSEAQDLASELNGLSEQIAQLNQEIYNQTIQGQDASNITDQRDQLVREMGEIVSIKTYSRDYGIVDVIVADIPLVVGSVGGQIKIGLVEKAGEFQLGLTPVESESYNTEVTGGKLGGLFELHNSIVKDIKDDFDLFTQTLVSEINKVHLQGVGSAGSFNSLSGWSMTDPDVADFVPAVVDGTIYIRVIDSSGDAQRYAVNVDASTSTLASVAADLALIPGLTNTAVNGDRLQIVANTGYQFDFLPGVMSTPTTTVPSPLAGAGAGADQAPPAVTVSGLYSGATNQTYTCTVNTSPPGQTLAVGNGTMELVVQDGSGTTVSTIQIGSEYTPGTTFIIDEEISISLDINGASAGYLNDGDVFTVQALSNSDTSGFLAAVGINCFFTGTDSNSISLTDAVRLSGTRIAVSRGQDGDDNRNVLQMARLGEDTLSALSDVSLKDYYRRVAVDVGHQLSVTELQYENSNAMMRNLEQQRDETSGVDINEEASLMMIYERVFQAMAKYMSTVASTQDMIMGILT